MTNREFRPGRGYTKEDWDAVDSPDATEEELASARPFAEVFPELAASIRRSSEAAAGMTVVPIPLDNALLAKLEASGPDWRRRVNEVLLRSLDLAEAVGRR